MAWCFVFACLSGCLVGAGGRWAAGRGLGRCRAGDWLRGRRAGSARASPEGAAARCLTWCVAGCAVAVGGMAGRSALPLVTVSVTVGEWPCAARRAP